ncbi:MAG: PD40 domain-containing protein [Deltaproteobacteria bacterium]|nr:PD40 domain-containing protein [Deltaproteobacteria bacterium]
MKQYVSIDRKGHAIGVPLIFFFLIISHAAKGGDPELAYHTLKTDHFNIHYDKSLQKLAERTAVAAENAYLLVTSTVGWKVEGPTEIHLVDNTDYSNGLASPYHYPFIQLYATPPSIDSSLQNNDDWLFSLVLHEFTHEAHVQMQYGVSRVYNTIFGDLFLPNSMIPRWFTEGLAVMMETYRTTRGRIRAPYYAMIMRTHSLEGKFQSLAEMSNATLDYPRGDADYVYGGMFMDYLRTRLGEQTIREICHKYAWQPLPYALNRVFFEVSGIPLKELFEDFTKAMKDNALAVQARILEEGETQSKRLTFTGENKGHAIIDAATGQFILPLADGQDRSAITAYPLSAAGVVDQGVPLALAGADASLCLDNQGNLYYVRTAPYKDKYRFRDLFVLEKGHQTPRRLTEGARVKSAAVSPDGRQAVIITNSAGILRMELLDLTDNTRRLLIPESEKMHYYAPTFSPDGKTLAFLWRQGGRVDVALMDMASEQAYYVTNDDAIEDDLRFTPDGKYLMFMSGVTGIDNVFARDMVSGALKQVTNVVSAARSPVPGPDGKTLYFLKYYSIGWDLHRTTVDLDALPLFVPPARTLVHSPDLADVPFNVNGAPYNPLPRFRPFSWEFTSRNVGGAQIVEISSLIEDAARLHTMNLLYSHNFSTSTPSFSASYIYNGLLPTFNLGFSWAQDEVPTGYLVGGMESPWIRRSWSADIGFSFPLMALDEHLSFSLGYSLNQSGPIENLPVEVDPNSDLPNMPTQYFRTGVRFGWSYSDTWNSPRAISREDGRTLGFAVSLYHPELGGDREQIAFSWRWREFRCAPFGENHVLAMELDGRAYVSNPNHQSSIYAGSYGDQDLVDAVLNESEMGLPLIRGYEADFISGDHYQSLRLEYRFPIWRAQLAYETLPVFFEQVHGAIFSDNLLISYDQFTMEDYFAAAGLELVWSFYLGYHMPMTLRTGYAHGFMEHGVNEFILVVGGSF